MEVEGEPPNRNAEELAKEGFYMGKYIPRHLLLPRVAIPYPLERVWSGVSYPGTLFALLAP